MDSKGELLGASSIVGQEESNASPTSRRLRSFVLLAVLSASPVWSFQCQPGHSVEAAFAEAERVFLVYVTETRLEEELVKKLAADSGDWDASEEHLKFVSAGYRVVEEFKGEVEYQPRLLDLLGIGTGYVGLIPGKYYLVLLPPPEEEELEYPDLRSVSICSVPFEHYRLQAEPFQAELDSIRKLRAGHPAGRETP